MTLLEKIKAAWAYAQTRLPFGINDWPSWLNEGAGGLVLMGGPGVLLVATGHPYIGAEWFVLARLFSEFIYERRLDANGFNPMDVLERDRGLIIALLVAILLA